VKKVKILALLAGVVAAILIFVLLSSVIKFGGGDKTQIVTAAQNIAANTVITEEMLTLSDVSSDSVLPGAVTKISDAVGKTVNAELYQGEQVISEKLISPGDSSNTTLAYAIDKGMRAITIAVDATTGVAGMIHPSDKVDIIGEFDYDGSVYTDLVAENINVLATDTNTSSSQVTGDGTIASYSTLTLEVTPHQAMELSSAAHNGTLRAVLRSPLDKKKLNYKSITLKKVLNLK
jgi:pilus assembly protein CpaB